VTGFLIRIVTLALGVALSPLPIVAVLVILLTKRARISSLVFVAAWVLGVATAITLALFFADQATQPPQGIDLPAEGLITFLLGLGLVIIAWLARRGRFRSADPDAPPTWVGAVDNLSPWGGALVAFTNATTSPKNLALAIAAALTIKNNIRPPAETTLAVAVYIAIASVTIVTPVVLFFVGGERSKGILREWKAKVTSSAAAATEIIAFFLGVGLAVKGLMNLLG